MARYIVRARHAFPHKFYSEEKERMGKMRNLAGKVFRVKDDTAVKRAAQHAADDVIEAIMKANGFIKGVLEFKQTEDLHIYCVADSLAMSPDDVRRLPPIAPLALDDHGESSQEEEDLDQKPPGVDSTALMLGDASLMAEASLLPLRVNHSCPQCSFLNPLGTPSCEMCGEHLATDETQDSVHESTGADGAEGVTDQIRSDHIQDTFQPETLVHFPRIKICTCCTCRNNASAVHCGICDMVLGKDTLHDLSSGSVGSTMNSDQQAFSKNEESAELRSRMERMEAMFQEQQEISQRQQVQNQAEKDALQKQVDEMSKKLEKLEKEYKKDGGKPVDIGALVALEADEVENAAGIREENQAKQDNFNFDMEDRMSRLYTHVAGLDERIAAQEKNHDRTEGFNAASLSTRKSRE
mmetsp:Transcript_3097/g.6952  ORF Transcript_3097/g.6952 Transcript_3097/m.6952 type:complete len:410 (-) Transcript_3097:2402-3631(-)